MALDMIYILLLMAWVGIVLGFYMKEYAILALSCIFLTVWGLYVIMYGLMGAQDWMTDAFAIVNLAVAVYVFIRGGYELYKEM